MAAVIPEILTLAEVARGLRVSERSLRNFIRREGVEAMKCGRQYRFDEKAVASLEAALRLPRSNVVDFPRGNTVLRIVSQNTV